MLFASRSSRIALLIADTSIAKRIAVGFAVLLVLSLATEALAARKARATGFYRVSRGNVNLPLQFILSAPSMTGYHSIPIAFPNPDAMFDTDISLVGKSP
ncbi:MAG: hypothetical protein JRH16_17835, partial [Deltaproteobacteria bacterium]|nr:hypothetical protein [Deltaproteobacteria bacterium]